MLRNKIISKREYHNLKKETKNSKKKHKNAPVTPSAVIIRRHGPLSVEIMLRATSVCRLAGSGNTMR